MPKVARPPGSEDAEDPVAQLGSILKASIIRYLRDHPNSTKGALADALQLGPSTIHPRLLELEQAGLVIADTPPGGSRKGVWVRYRIDDEAVTDLYLRLGFAIGEF